MMNTIIEAFGLVLQTDVLLAILLASIYGLVVGSLPGLSATMATALLVPVTFYLSPIAAVATIISAPAPCCAFPARPPRPPIPMKPMP